MLNQYEIRKAEQKDAAAAAQLAMLLWPDHDCDDLIHDFTELSASNLGVVFLCLSEAQPVGLAICQLRHDYVEGTDSSPVGYLEGIYVHPDHHKKGCARMMLHACEDWARVKGCTEFASDCPITNADSLAFHLKVGFAEANRIICFTRKL